MLILGLFKGRCTFVTSEFPSEIPRTQNRNYSYTKPLAIIRKKIIMDRMTKILVEELNQSIGQSGKNNADKFENFVNYTITTTNFSKSFDISNINTGGGNDTGIDGIAIIVNDQLIEHCDEITDIINNGNKLRVEYIFIQSKTSEGFKTSEIGQFTHGILDFLSEEPTIVRNEEIEKFAEISNFIIQNSAHMLQAPTCKIFYVTLGRVNSDKNIDGRIETGKQDILNTNMFSEVGYKRLGATEICNKYRKTKDAITSTINFVSKVTLPSIDGVDEAYIGILPLSEFKKIVKDNNGKVRNVFDDNVRDFQGTGNPVNKKIDTTLSSQQPDLFSVLNNGVTIVASSLITVSNSFTLKDYQIVNGCQTSNILAQYTDISELKDLSIPLKIIVTENDKVKTQITIATNSQTAIRQDQLSALSNFLRDLEHYYNTFEVGEGKLYFERRARQYASDGTVQKSRITTIQIQIKSFASMFLKEPERVTSFYGVMVKQIQNEGKSIFVDGQRFETYYLSGLAYYRMISLFNKGLIDKKYKKVKFFVLMVFNAIAGKNKDISNHLNSKKIVQAYCNPIIEMLLDENKSERLFKKATKLIDKSGLDIEDKAAIKVKSATETLLNQLKK